MLEYDAKHSLGAAGLWYCRLISVWGLDQLAADESQAPNPSGAILEDKAETWSLSISWQGRPHLYTHKAQRL